MGAARAWAAGTLLSTTLRHQAIEDDALADARRFGLDAGTIDALSRQRWDDGFAGVYAGNVGIVLAFLAVASQWRTMLLTSRSGFRSRVLGLDYTGAKVALDALGFAVTPSLWAGLVTMEHAAVTALNGETAVEVSS